MRKKKQKKIKKNVLKSFFKSFREWWTARRAAIALTTTAVLIVFIAQVKLQDLIVNAVTEIVGIAITVLIIDYLNERRAEKQRLVDLVRQLGSRDNGTVLRALDEIRDLGLLSNGNLTSIDLRYANLARADLKYAILNKTILFGADLTLAELSTRAHFRIGEGGEEEEAGYEEPIDPSASANLSRAILDKARLIGTRLNWVNLSSASFFETDLTNASLFEANLQYADGLESQQLAKAFVLLGATMPYGGRYDGRFRLKGDIGLANYMDINVQDNLAMATYYGVSLDKYESGQRWADQNLSNARDETIGSPLPDWVSYTYAGEEEE